MTQQVCEIILLSFIQISFCSIVKQVVKTFSVLIRSRDLIHDGIRRHEGKRSGNVELSVLPMDTTTAASLTGVKLKTLGDKQTSYPILLYYILQLRMNFVASVEMYVALFCLELNLICCRLDKEVMSLFVTFSSVLL